MKRGEVWLINLEPTVGSEIKKRVQRLVSMMMLLVSYRCA